VTSIRGPRNASVWTVEVANTGRGTAYDVRLSALRYLDERPIDQPRPVVLGLNPNDFPVPVVGLLPPGQATTVDVTLDLRGAPVHRWKDLDFTLSADGGRVMASTRRGGKPQTVQLS